MEQTLDMIYRKLSKATTIGQVKMVVRMANCYQNRLPKSDFETLLANVAWQNNDVGKMKVR